MSAKNIAVVLGIILVLVGLAGFVGGLGIVGPEGYFVTNTSHDVVHLITGIIFLWVALKSMGALGTTLKVFGVIYILLAIIGFFSGDMLLGVFSVNMADHILHLVLGIIILWGGFMASKNSMGGGMA